MLFPHSNPHQTPQQANWQPSIISPSSGRLKDNPNIPTSPSSGPAAVCERPPKVVCENLQQWCARTQGEPAQPLKINLRSVHRLI